MVPIPLAKATASIRMPTGIRVSNNFSPNFLMTLLILDRILSTFESHFSTFVRIVLGYLNHLSRLISELRSLCHLPYSYWANKKTGNFKGQISCIIGIHMDNFIPEGFSCLLSSISCLIRLAGIGILATLSRSWIRQSSVSSYS